MTWLYRLLRFLALCVFWPLFLPRVYGREGLRAEGPYIMVCNHRNNIDPIFLSMFIKRHVTFLAKSELKSVPILGWCVRVYGAIYINRGTADLAALRKALDVLKGGGVLGIFPQGTRRKTAELGKLEEGVGFLAVKSGVPVIPVFIDGRYIPFRRERVDVGPPIVFDDLKERLSGSELIGAATERIGSAILGLRAARENDDKFA